MGILSQDELKRILGHFALPEKKYVLDPLNIGYINDTFLVSDSVPIYILQRINHSIFTNVEGLMGNVNLALGHLKDVDYESVQLIPTLSGKPFFASDSGYWRVMTYIKDSISYNTTTLPEIASEAGRIIGKFHILLKKAEKKQFVDTIPNFHSLDLREHQFKTSLQKASLERTSKAEHAISFACDALEQLKRFDVSKIPMRICHNDTKFNNILFSKTTNKALCIIDLDTVMNGFFLYDFGDAIRTIVNTAPEDEKNHNKITFERELFRAFVMGMAKNTAFLTKTELKTLPFGVVLMPFLHGIRALTDYLNNDLYYKVTYPDQNLDRCLSLFNFTKKAQGELEFMSTMVEQNLPTVQHG